MAFPNPVKQASARKTKRARRIANLKTKAVSSRIEFPPQRLALRPGACGRIRKRSPIRQVRQFSICYSVLNPAANLIDAPGSTRSQTVFTRSPATSSSRPFLVFIQMAFPNPVEQAPARKTKRTRRIANFKTKAVSSRIEFPPQQLALRPGARGIFRKPWRQSARCRLGNLARQSRKHKRVAYGPAYLFTDFLFFLGGEVRIIGNRHRLGDNDEPPFPNQGLDAISAKRMAARRTHAAAGGGCAAFRQQVLNDPSAGKTFAGFQQVIDAIGLSTNRIHFHRATLKGRLNVVIKIRLGDVKVRGRSFSEANAPRNLVGEWGNLRNADRPIHAAQSFAKRCPLRIRQGQIPGDIARRHRIIHRGKRLDCRVYIRTHRHSRDAELRTRVVNASERAGNSKAQTVNSRSRLVFAINCPIRNKIAGGGSGGRAQQRATDNIFPAGHARPVNSKNLNRRIGVSDPNTRRRIHARPANGNFSRAACGSASRRTASCCHGRLSVIIAVANPVENGLTVHVRGISGRNGAIGSRIRIRSVSSASVSEVIRPEQAAERQTGNPAPEIRRRNIARFREVRGNRAFRESRAAEGVVAIVNSHNGADPRSARFARGTACGATGIIRAAVGKPSGHIIAGVRNGEGFNLVAKRGHRRAGGEQGHRTVAAFARSGHPNRNASVGSRRGESHRRRSRNPVHHQHIKGDRRFAAQHRMGKGRVQRVGVFVPRVVRRSSGNHAVRANRRPALSSLVGRPPSKFRRWRSPGCRRQPQAE